MVDSTSPGPNTVRPKPIRGRNGRFTANADTAARDAEAARLRIRALSYREIAEQLGYADEGHAYAAVQRSLLATISEPSQEVRRLEIARLDKLYAAALAVLERMHVTVSNGRVVYFGDEPLSDDAPVLAAIDRLLKIQDRRARYLGLDAPTSLQVVTIDAVDAEIARLSAELAAQPGPPAPVQTQTAAGAATAQS